MGLGYPFIGTTDIFMSNGITQINGFIKRPGNKKLWTTVMSPVKID